MNSGVVVPVGGFCFLRAFFAAARILHFFLFSIPCTNFLKEVYMSPSRFFTFRRQGMRRVTVLDDDVRVDLSSFRHACEWVNTGEKSPTVLSGNQEAPTRIHDQSFLTILFCFLSLGSPCVTRTSRRQRRTNNTAETSGIWVYTEWPTLKLLPIFFLQIS